MFTAAFIRATLERAVKTIAQTAVGVLIGNGTGLLDTDWVGVASVAGMAGVISLLTSFGSDVLTEGSGPSAVDAEVLSE